MRGRSEQVREEEGGEKVHLKGGEKYGKTKEVRR